MDKLKVLTQHIPSHTIPPSCAQHWALDMWTGEFSLSVTWPEALSFQGLLVYLTWPPSWWIWYQDTCWGRHSEKTANHAKIPAVNHNHNKMCFCNRSINPPSRYCRPHLDCNQETVRLSKGIFVNSQSVFCLSLNSPFRVFILIVCSDSFIKYTYFTYIMILAGFLPNISCECKYFVATWARIV